jgi:hypothetical protein
MQPLVAAAGQGRAQAQGGQMPGVPEHRPRGARQQRMPAARGEVRVGPVQHHAHHAPFGRLGGRSIRVSGPGRDRLPDQLLQAAGNRAKDRLVQQRGHQQVTIALQRFPLLGA